MFTRVSGLLLLRKKIRKKSSSYTDSDMQAIQQHATDCDNHTNIQQTLKSIATCMQQTLVPANCKMQMHMSQNLPPVVQ